MAHGAGSLAAAIEARYGLVVDERGRALLEEAPTPEEGLERLLVQETSFFRHEAQLRALVEALRPRVRGQGPIRILSAGCATGAEPASVAILLRERFPTLDLRRIHLAGLDVSPAALEQARAGRYGPWQLRNVPPAARRRWFDLDGSDHVLVPEIRHAVTYRAANLLDERALRPTAWHAILCRNVLIHLTEAASAALLRRLVAALAPGGWLVLGPSDIPRARPDDLEVVRFERSLLYRRVLRDVPRARAPRRTLEPTRPCPLPRRTAAPPSPAPAPASDPEAPLAALREERYDRALALLPAPGEGADEVVRAALLLHLGRIDEAEAACRRALDADAGCGDAHHAFSLARVARGDLGGAGDHARIALYLDPRFALAHAHASRVHERCGRRRAARRHLERATALLADESERRVRLFGGGFDRAALIELCRGRLDRLEGR